MKNICRFLVCFVVFSFSVCTISFSNACNCAPCQTCQSELVATSPYTSLSICQLEANYGHIGDFWNTCGYRNTCSGSPCCTLPEITSSLASCSDSSQCKELCSIQTAVDQCYAGSANAANTLQTAINNYINVMNQGYSVEDVAFIFASGGGYPSTQDQQEAYLSNKQDFLNSFSQDGGFTISLFCEGFQPPPPSPATTTTSNMVQMAAAPVMDMEQMVAPAMDLEQVSAGSVMDMEQMPVTTRAIVRKGMVREIMVRPHGFPIVHKDRKGTYRGGIFFRAWSLPKH